MKRYALIGALVLGAAELGAIGCNAVLGNEEGQLLADASTISCAPDEKACGACVKTNDPKVGCGGECTVCPTPSNGQSSCVLQKNVQTCALGACNTQFADCDQDASDGCETHTTTRAHCGDCTTSCTEPFCVPSPGSATGYACSATCDLPNVQCDGGTGVECVDPTSDNGNCGGCGIDCTVANGTGTCKSSVCQIACDPGFFNCGGKCALPTNAACGPSCTPCAAQTHCDRTAGNGTYGTCVPNGGTVDAGCASGLTCNGTCCVSGENCCNGNCTSSSSSSCGANCDKCNSGTSCVADQCACDTPGQTLCSDNGTPANRWCCTAGTCGVTAGSCVTMNTCPGSQCPLGAAACGCPLSNGVTTVCKPPNTGAACGASCTVCGSADCCCPGLGIDGGASYACQPGSINVDGGVTCSGVCNP